MSGRDSLSLKRLREFQPLDRLTDDQLVLLASRAERRRYRPGQRLIERGTRDGMEFFLLAGGVEMESGDQRRSVVTAASPKAATALARLQPRMYTVIATEPSECLVIAQEALNHLLRSAPVADTALEAGESDGDGMAGEEQTLLMEFYAELRANRLVIPSVPDVAWKVRRAADREESTAEQVANAVTADPAMAAKLVRACNSPLYRGFSDVRNVREAVVRLGMRTTRQLVTVFAMRELFRSRHPLLQKRMEQLWRYSRQVAALSWVLADSETSLDPEEALLAGLLHSIGAIPVLVHAEHYRSLLSDEQKLDYVVAELQADTGAAVMENWGFPEPFVEAVRHATDWQYQSRKPAPALVDVVVLAGLHARLAAHQNAGLPGFDEVPAYRRLGELPLNASRSLEILTRARSRVDEVHKLLSIH